MKIIRLLILALLLGLILFLLSHFFGFPKVASAEMKQSFFLAEMKQSFFLAEIKQPGFGTSIGIIPKLPKTPNDPIFNRQL